MFDLPVRLVLEHYGAVLPPPKHGWIRHLCCFHEEKKPSAAHNIALNGFNCLGCGMTGNGITLIMKHEGVKYAEASERAGQWFGTSYEPVRNESGNGRRLSHRTRYRQYDCETPQARIRSGSLFGEGS